MPNHTASRVCTASISTTEILFQRKQSESFLAWLHACNGSPWLRGIAALVTGIAVKKLGLFAVIAAFALKFFKLIAVAAVAGTAAALACYVLARHFDSGLLLALAYAGFFLNLFNLIPVSPLDGGRITAILSPRVWLLGAPVLAAVFLWRPSPILIMIGVFAIPQLIAAWRYDPDAPANKDYYKVSLEDKFTYGTFYVGLIVFLSLMLHDLHQELGSGQ